jgi:Protein of unknown function (DUF3800)
VIQTPEELKVANYWLLVFMDESGHETFAGNQPYYAVGGCAILGEHYAAEKTQWRELRRTINGDPDSAPARTLRPNRNTLYMAACRLATRDIHEIAQARHRAARERSTR